MLCRYETEVESVRGWPDQPGGQYHPESASFQCIEYSPRGQTSRHPGEAEQGDAEQRAPDELIQRHLTVINHQSSAIKQHNNQHLVRRVHTSATGIFQTVPS